MQPPVIVKLNFSDFIFSIKEQSLTSSVLRAGYFLKPFNCLASSREFGFAFSFVLFLAALLFDVHRTMPRSTICHSLDLDRKESTR